MSGERQSRDRIALATVIANIVRDQQAIWTSPFHSAPADVARWLAFTLATGALVAADRRIESMLPPGEEIQASKMASQLGTVYTLIPAVALVIMTGRAVGNRDVEDIGWRGIEAMVDTEIVAQTWKLATQRPRPDRSDGGRFWRGGNSFPSAHSIKAWALAAIASERFTDKRVGAAACLWALTISVARLLGRRHFASDALAGSVMGWFIGAYVAHRPGLALPRAENS